MINGTKQQPAKPVTSQNLHILRISVTRAPVWTESLIANDSEIQNYGALLT